MQATRDWAWCVHTQGEQACVGKEVKGPMKTLKAGKEPQEEVQLSLAFHKNSAPRLPSLVALGLGVEVVLSPECTEPS